MTSRIPSFSKKAKKSHGPGSKVVTVSLHRCSSQSRPLTPGTSKNSIASSSSSTLDGTPSVSISKVRKYPSRCVDMIISGVSAILLIPMPFLDSMKGDKSSKGDVPTETSEPRGLQRILSRRSQQGRRKRNSLVLPEVPMPDEPDEPASPIARTSQCTIRENPPSVEDRTVRFIIPSPKLAAPIQSRWRDEEPAWSDFM